MARRRQWATSGWCLLDLVHLDCIALVSEQSLDAAHRARERVVDHVSNGSEGKFEKVEE
jgi:hypothetical protein